MHFALICANLRREGSTMTCARFLEERGVFLAAPMDDDNSFTQGVSQNRKIACCLGGNESARATEVDSDEDDIYDLAPAPVSRLSLPAIGHASGRM
jgi:hypothetical protein